MQSLRAAALALLVWCQPYAAYEPVTGASYAAPHATVMIERDASGELPSTTESGDEKSPAYGALPLFPFFPILPVPQLDVGRGYEPRTQPVAPAYGPGGGPR